MTPALQAAIQTAYATFERQRDQLLQAGPGKYALVHGEQVLGVWDTYEDALQAGYERCGIDSGFLVQRIQGPLEGIQFFTRDLSECRS